jgi:hypothetical protein
VLPESDFVYSKEAMRLKWVAFCDVPRPPKLVRAILNSRTQGLVAGANHLDEPAQFARVSVKVSLDIPLQKPHFSDE